MAQERSPRTVQAVQTSLDIIEFVQERGGAGVTEIAEALDLSKGTVHGHLTTLVENEYLAADDGAYRLSLRYLDLGETVKDRLEIYDVVTEELDDLAAESGELAQFATYEHGRAVYLYKARGEKAIESASRVGKREYLHCISLGKAILAHLPSEEVDEIVDEHGLPAATAKTITDRDALFEELAQIREQGYAVDDEEKIPGLKCIAAPVRGPDGAVLGAVSVTGPSSRMVGARFDEEIPNMVKRSTNVIEINSKFS